MFDWLVGIVVVLLIALAAPPEAEPVEAVGESMLLLLVFACCWAGWFVVRPREELVVGEDEAEGEAGEVVAAVLLGS